MTSKLSLLFLLPRLAHAYKTKTTTTVTPISTIIAHQYGAAGINGTCISGCLAPSHLFRARVRASSHLNSSRSCFSTTNNPPLLKAGRNNFPPRPKPPPEEEIEESFLKGSGPGGQKINKTNSAVQLKHLPTGLVIKCQATRSRSQNRNIARQLLADKLDDMTRGDQSRSAVVGEVKRKKRASSAKKSRRKYRKLDGEKDAATSEAWDEEDEGDGVDDDAVEEEPYGEGDTRRTDDSTPVIHTTIVDRKE